MTKEEPDKTAAADEGTDKKRIAAQNKTAAEIKERKAFKPHPAFSRGGKRAKSFRDPHKAPVDPALRIIEQHIGHKVRIAKLAAVIFAVIVAISFFAFQIQNYHRRKEFSKKIENIMKQIETLDVKIAESSGYAKYRAAFNAIACIETANSLDFKNQEKWNRMKEKYLLTLEGNGPVSGSDFVVPLPAIDMVNIPLGRFYMGRRAEEPGGEPDELPRHAVVINYEFWISRTEITNAQFREYFPTHKTQIWNMYKLDGPHQPAVEVDWHLASAFCTMLTEKEQSAGRVPKDYEYRLPSEAEWEYACRAGTETYYFWGDTFEKTGAEFANTRDLRATRLLDWKEEKGMSPDDGHIVSSPAGSYKPNAFGLHDMTGNVWEWCWDWYNPRAYSELPETDPVHIKPIASNLEVRAVFDRRYTVESTSKVIRGGSWGNTPSECRSAARDSTVPEMKNTGIGFRIVLAPKISQLSPK